MNGQQTFYTGQMQCLCTDIAKDIGKKAAKEKMFTVKFADNWEEKGVVQPDAPFERDV